MVGYLTPVIAALQKRSPPSAPFPTSVDFSRLLSYPVYTIDMSANKNIIIAFDLYGTLLSTESIAKELSQHFGEEKAQTIATVWRRYQLEYTWRLNSMSTSPRGLPHHPTTKLRNFFFSLDQYEPFSAITVNSLRHALADSSVSLPAPAVEQLMKAYDSLSTFADVPPALRDLAAAPGITPVVFSNGTTAMVTNSVTQSPDLGPHATVFKDMVTVEAVRKFKPHPDVYYHLAESVGKDRGQMASMWLVSGNPFDVVGSRAVGMQAAWVDRAGNGWTDELVQGEKGRPTVVVKGLGEVLEAVKKHAAQ